MKSCKDCGKEWSGKGSRCNTCKSRSRRDAPTPQNAPTLHPPDAPTLDRMKASSKAKALLPAPTFANGRLSVVGGVEMLDGVPLKRRTFAEACAAGQGAY